MPDEEDLVAAHLQTINNQRSQCFFSTERSHSNIVDFLGKILRTEMSVKVPLTIATADGRQARLAVVASQFPFKKDGVDATSYHRDVVNGMRSMLMIWVIVVKSVHLKFCFPLSMHIVRLLHWL